MSHAAHKLNEWRGGRPDTQVRRFTRSELNAIVWELDARNARLEKRIYEMRAQYRRVVAAVGNAIASRSTERTSGRIG